jgi:hypothetical protein
MISSNHICVSSAHRERRQPTSAIGLVLLAAGALAGCSMSDGIGPYIVDPGAYAVFRCDALKQRLTELLVEEDDLSKRFDKASEGGGGFVIGSMAYRTDYEITLGKEKLLRRTAAEKKCELPPPASAASATVPTFQSDQIIR